jgi:uncharacterized membrane protein
MKTYKLDNATASAIQFSDYFGFEKNANFQEQIQQHPFYPSLFSISEVLENEAGIKNFAVKIKTEQLNEVNLPCLAHLKTKGGEYALITAIKDNSVSYNLDGKNKKLSFSDFEKIWTGVVLVSESQKRDLKQKIDFAHISTYLLPLCAFLLLVITFSKTVNLSFFNPLAYSGQFICLLAGLIISVLLLIQSLGRSNSLIQQLCGGEAKHNCNHILSSKAAQITPWFSLSDLGFLYFSGSFLILLLSANSLATNAIIYLNLMALPFTFWSVYYQWQIAKTWCRLCLMIQGLFWLQAMFSIWAITQSNIPIAIPNINDVLMLATAYLFPKVLWLSTKELFKNNIKNPQLKRELNRLKYNVDAFKNLLHSQNQYIGTLPKKTIVLGNPNAALQITMVSNPFCNPCAQAHQFLEEWIAKGIDFRLNIVYTFSMDDNDQQKQFFKQLLALQKTDEKQVESALHDWYSLDYQKLENWKIKYPANSTIDDKIELLEQVNWCKLNEIKGTPTFFINSYKLPENYRLKDLKYVLMNLE